MKKLLIFIATIILFSQSAFSQGRLGNRFIYAKNDTIWVKGLGYIVGIDSLYVPKMKTDSITVTEYYYQMEIGIVDSMTSWIYDGDTLNIDASTSANVIEWKDEGVLVFFIDSTGNPVISNTAPIFILTDIDVNLNTSTSAQRQDSAAWVIDASQTNPQLKWRGADGAADAWELTGNTDDAMVFQNASGGYSFDDTLRFTAIAGDVAIRGSFDPVDDESHDLGRPDLRWSGTYSNIFYAGDSTTGDQDGIIYFADDGDETAESLMWDDGDDRFEFSDDLLIEGALGLESLVITPTSAGTKLDFELETEWVSGTLIRADFGGATTATDDIIYQMADFNTNFTPLTDKDITIYQAKTPAFTQTSANTTTFIGYDLPTAGALVNTNGTLNWIGNNIVMPNITQTSGAIISIGLKITDGAVTTDGTQYGIDISAGGAPGTTRAINVGAGWDAGLYISSKILITDNIPLVMGGGNDVLFKWDTNGAGDGLFVSLCDKVDANASVAWWMARDLDPSGMIDHDDYLSPTRIIVNDENADVGDYAGVVIGERTNADVTTTHYFDFYSMVGAADGTPDGTATELGATYRFGNSLTAADHATTAGDVIFNDIVEVDGALYAESTLDVEGLFTSLGIDDNATTNAITIEADEDVILTQNLALVTTKEFLFDGGGGHTKIAETSDDVLTVTVGGETMILLTELTPNTIGLTGNTTVTGTFNVTSTSQFDDSLLFSIDAAVIQTDSVLTFHSNAVTPANGFVEFVRGDNSGAFVIGRTTATAPSILSITDGGADNEQALICLYDDAGGGQYIWVATDHKWRVGTSSPADDDAGGYAIIDADDGTIGATGQPGLFSTVTGTGKISTLLTTEQLRLSYDATNYFAITVGDAGQTDFVTVDADARLAHLTFNPDGAVGFGATPENWRNTYTALQFGGMGAIWGHASAAASNYMFIGNNVYHDGTDTRDEYIIGDEASSYYMSDGAHVFRTAAVGVADNPITWTNVLQLEADGDIIMFNGTDTKDYTLTFNGFTADGVITYMEDEDRIDFDNDVDVVADLTAGTITSDGKVAGSTYGSDASITDAELLTLDDGATTEILVGGGAGSTPVWTTVTGTGAPVKAVSPTFTGTIGAAAITATGIISGMSDITLDTDPTVALGAADCKNMIRFNNDADVIDYTLPAAEAGLVVMFYDIGGGVITIDPVDGVDTIYLNGTSVGAGDAIDSPGAVGNFICLVALDATRWVTVGRSGVWVDGGVD